MTDIAEQLTARGKALMELGQDPDLMFKASGEIRLLRMETQKLAGFLMSGYTSIHESKTAELDLALKPYLGKEKGNTWEVTDHNQ
jgi:hypothetical protein